jgi:hypothetical protein
MCQPRLTMEEIKERLLQRYDPDDLVESLDLSSEEILDRFEDKLINKLEYFEQELEDETYNEEY